MAARSGGFDPPPRHHAPRGLASQGSAARDLVRRGADKFSEHGLRRIGFQKTSQVCLNPPGLVPRRRGDRRLDGLPLTPKCVKDSRRTFPELSVILQQEESSHSTQRVVANPDDPAVIRAVEPLLRHHNELKGGPTKELRATRQEANLPFCGVRHAAGAPFGRAQELPESCCNSEDPNEPQQDPRGFTHHRTSLRRRNPDCRCPSP